MASEKVSIGAIRNSTRLAPTGTTVSFISILMASAMGCSRPNGPTTLGPLRNWMAASTLALGIGEIGDREQQRQQDGQHLQHDQHQAAEAAWQRTGRRLRASRRYSAACAASGACTSVHSAMVGLARLIGSVW